MPQKCDISVTLIARSLLNHLDTAKGSKGKSKLLYFIYFTDGNENNANGIECKGPDQNMRTVPFFLQLRLIMLPLLISSTGWKLYSIDSSLL